MGYFTDEELEEHKAMNEPPDYGVGRATDDPLFWLVLLAFLLTIILLPFFGAAAVGVGGALLVAGTVSWLINFLFGGT